MRFNSIVFVEFALLFFFGWALIGRRKPAALWYLVIASWLFYGYETWWFVPILVGTASIDWALALAMVRWPNRKKVFLVTSCASNLGVLGVFKYSGFVTQSFNDLLRLHFSTPHILLPIGISFYTFQSLSYIFDVYRGETQPTTKWIEFLSIVSLFAHLVAGPIVRVSSILPQIQLLRKPSHDDLWAGIDLICVGFFKKIVLADRLASYVDIVYAEARPTGAAALLATVAFAFQIYYDFGGYTDIARGIARLLGLDFGVNFNHPYTAIGLADFWTRWHISLTTWVRDYLYFPLGGNRKGVLRTHFNLWVCMLLSGLWHGANWTFVVWGVFHAAFLSLEKITNWPRRVGKTRAGRLLGAMVTFAIVTAGWVFFRSESIVGAWSFLGDMVHLNGIMGEVTAQNFVVFMILAIGIGYEAKVLLERRGGLALKPIGGNMLAIRNGVLLALCLVAPATPKTFIYFQF